MMSWARKSFVIRLHLDAWGNHYDAYFHGLGDLYDRSQGFPTTNDKDLSFCIVRTETRPTGGNAWPAAAVPCTSGNPRRDDVRRLDVSSTIAVSRCCERPMKDDHSQHVSLVILSQVWHSSGLPVTMPLRGCGVRDMANCDAVLSVCLL